MVRVPMESTNRAAVLVSISRPFQPKQVSKYNVFGYVDVLVRKRFHGVVLKPKIPIGCCVAPLWADAGGNAVYREHRVLEQKNRS